MIPTRKQWKAWSLPSKYALVGVVIGLIGLIPVFLAFIPEPPVDPASRTAKPSQFASALLLAHSEITGNIKCIDAQRKQLENDLEWPICRQSHSSIDTLFQNFFYDIGIEAYGEDNTLIGQWKKIASAIDERNKVKYLGDLRILETKSEVSIRDLYFQHSFLLWYLGFHMEKELGHKSGRPSDTPEDVTSIPDVAWNKWPAKTTTDYDGARVSNFGLWLGLLD